jgi:hypothetical protein
MTEPADLPPGARTESVDVVPVGNEPAPAGPERRSRVRGWLSMVLVVLASLAVLAAVIAYWAHETVFDTDAFMDTVGPTLEDPAFYSTMSGYVTDQTLEALDIDTRVTDALDRLDTYLSEAIVEAIDPDPQVLELLSRFDRPSLTALAPSISAALETRVADRIDSFVTSDEFRTAVVELVRRGHEAGVALVRGDLAELPNVTIEDGEVRLSLIPLITATLQRIFDEIREFLPDVTLPDIVSDRATEARQQLAEALRAELPEDFGQLTVMSEEDLNTAQEAASRFDRLVWLIAILAVVLIAAAIAVAPNRRRAVIHVALGVVIAVILGVAAVRRLEAAIIDRIQNPDGAATATSLMRDVVGDLRRLVWVIVVVAVVVAVAAYLAGRPPWLERLREQRAAPGTAAGSGASDLDRWIAPKYDGLRIAGIALAVAILFFTGIGVISVLVIGGLLALYLGAISAARNRAAVPPPDGADAPVTVPAGPDTGSP